MQAGGETVNTIKKTLTSPLELLQQVDEEIEARFQNLITRGELAKEEAIAVRDKLLAAAKPPEKIHLLGQNQIEKILSKRGVPTKDDINAISKQIDYLTEKLESLMDDPSSSTTS